MWQTLIPFLVKVSYISSSQYEYFVFYSSNIGTADVAGARSIPRLDFLNTHIVYIVQSSF